MNKDRLKISIKVFIIWTLAFVGTKFFNGLIKAPSHSIYIFPFENNIPYIPEFFPIYFLAVPLVILPLFLIKNKNIFNQMVKAYLITIITTIVILLIYPIKLVRPLVEGTGIYYSTIQFFYKILPAYTIFPSLHMSLMMLSSLYIRKENKKLGNILLISTLIIAISILLVKTHYLIDLIVGFILSLIVYKIVSK